MGYGMEIIVNIISLVNYILYFLKDYLSYYFF